MNSTPTSPPSYRAEFLSSDELNHLKKQLNISEIVDLRASIYAELFKILNPEITSKNPHFEKLSKEFIYHKYSEKSEIWVFYPWKNSAYCIPSEEDFVKVRTSRNQYKLTPREQALLSRKKVGIIGLSVGQTIALTMAMERSATEFRLADYDVLELSNINRLRSGISNIGLKKVVIAAREIAEIDPFINVIIYPEGITRDNLDDFLLEGGKIDLLVDECDGLDIKILARHRARELRIPVLMDTSDRGMLDVERYDLEPERPILHGLATGLDPDTIHALTNEEKIPFILDMVSAEHMSTRLKASMLEVQYSINTWPQLASSVFLGGAMGADTARRIFLNQFSDSGRYYLDFEELIPGQSSDTSSNAVPAPPSPRDWQRFFTDFVRKIQGGNSYTTLSQDEIDALIRAASIAPSGGNVQPWKWLLFEDVFYLFIDEHRAHSFLDVDHLGSLIALGAAIENFETAAKYLNLQSSTILSPDPQHPILVAKIKITGRTASSNREQSRDQMKALYHRHTNRLKGSTEPLNPAFFELVKRFLPPQERVVVVTERQHIDAFADLAGIADRIRLTHPWAHFDFMSETRWTDSHARATGDGIDIETLNPTTSDRAAFRILRDWKTLALTSEWGLGKGLEKMSRETVQKSGAVMMLYTTGKTKESIVSLGKSLEKVWIMASRFDIAFQPVSPITFLIYRYLKYPDSYYQVWQKELLNDSFQKIKTLFGLTDDYAFGFVFRLFRSTDTVKKSYRLPVHQIFTHIYR
ncbi:MAG: Rv1355c family protein [Thermaurantimonas sp.]